MRCQQQSLSLHVYNPQVFDVTLTIEYTQFKFSTCYNDFSLYILYNCEHTFQHYILFISIGNVLDIIIIICEYFLIQKIYLNLKILSTIQYTKVIIIDTFQKMKVTWVLKYSYYSITTLLKLNNMQVNNKKITIFWIQNEVTHIL